jgi:protein involved in polysaccharide export with SLBB domain
VRSPLLLLPTVLLALAIALAGCGSNEPKTHTVGKLGEQAADSGTNYRLGVGDKVHVTVMGQADLSGESEVDAGGKIVVGMAGAVDAAGATVTEVADRIRASLAGNILRDPKVAVQVTEYRPITVTGEVKSPGRYKFTFGLDVRSAVAMGGGYEKRANKDAVIVYRDNKPLEAHASSTLEPGDTVEVARR